MTIKTKRLDGSFFVKKPNRNVEVYFSNLNKAMLFFFNFLAKIEGQPSLLCSTPTFTHKKRMAKRCR